MARDFAGVSDLLGLPVTAELRPNLPVTISAWIRPDVRVNGGGIFTTNKTTTQHRGFWFNLSGTAGELEASFGSNGGTASSARRSKVSATAACGAGVWSHVACCIRGAGDMDIYKGGTDAGGSYSGTGGAMGYDTAVAGRIGMVGNIFFDGRIAEVALWNVSLSATEVGALAKGATPSTVQPLSLIGYWPIWGIADPEPDLSIKRNNPTVTGAVLANHSPTGPHPRVLIGA